MSNLQCLALKEEFDLKLSQTVSIRCLLVGVLCGILGASTRLYADTPATRLLEPRFLSNKSYAQIYTLSALLEDSTFLQIQLTLTNLGISNRNAACKAFLLRKRTPPLCWNNRYGSNQWSYATDTSERLHIGTSHILIQGNQTVVCVDNEKLRARVTFACAPSPVVPPNAAIRANNRFYDCTFLIGWSRLQAVIERPGSAPQTLEGNGVLELSHSTSLPTDISRGWLIFRGSTLSGSYLLANVRVPCQRDSLATGWSWRLSEKLPTALRGLAFEPDQASAVPGATGLKSIAAPDHSFAIAPQKLLYRYSFVEELGPVVGYIVKLVIGDPVTYYYVADAHVAGIAPALPGILEVTRIE